MRSIILSLIVFAGVIAPIIPAPARASEISASEITRIVDAIYVIEGGTKAQKPFGILSVPCRDFDDCRRVCENTVRNNYKRWELAGRPGDYLAFLAARYAPADVANDPGNLNRHWLGNLRAQIKKGG